MAFSEAGCFQARKCPDFLQEPDDPRVLVPAHRIGDAPVKSAVALDRCVFGRAERSSAEAFRVHREEAQAEERSWTFAGPSASLKCALRCARSLPSLSGTQMKLHSSQKEAEPDKAGEVLGVLAPSPQTSCSCPTLVFQPTRKRYAFGFVCELKGCDPEASRTDADHGG